MKHRECSRGFTLIELMIVVVIIGLLAAMAVPRFMTAVAKSRQSEAKQMLKQIYTLERSYRQEHFTYWGAGATASSDAQDAFSTIGVSVMSSARYTYDIITADDNTLLVRATCSTLDDDDADDIWEIDDEGDLVCTSDDTEI